ncbi:MAG: copper-binding protein [Magnetococcales bacterium]|nr:copper-binding protein [Magnetococcales bacterium]
MYHTLFLAIAFVLSLTVQSNSVWADSHGFGSHDMQHSGMNHSDHQMPTAKMDHTGNPAEMAMPMNQADAMGTIQSINSEGNMVSLSHDPIPALGWPAMTMDLPVTKRVDLSQFKTGETVHFTLKKGRDNQFRIISMMPSH